MHVSFCHSAAALLQTAILGPLAVLTVAQEPSSILSPSSQTVGLDLNTDTQWE